MKFIGSKTQLLKVSLFLTLFCFYGAPVFANEEGGEHGGGEHEGGEHGGEGAAAKPKTNVESYRNVRARVMGYVTQMKASEDKIQMLSREKKSTKDGSKQNELITQMLTEHTDLEKVFKDYQREYSRMVYEYPDKGDEAPRKYTRFRLKSLDELEQGAGLDTDLDRARAQLHKTYGELPPPEKRAVSAKPGKGDPDDDDEEISRPTLKK